MAFVTNLAARISYTDAHAPAGYSASPPDGYLLLLRNCGGVGNTPNLTRPEVNGQKNEKAHSFTEIALPANGFVLATSVIIPFLPVGMFEIP